MKVKFTHASDNILEVIGVTQQRVNDIMFKAQQNMIKNFSHGSLGRFLEYVIDECANIDEVIAATIEWKGKTDYMRQIHEMQQRANTIKPPPGNGIIKPS